MIVAFLPVHTPSVVAGTDHIAFDQDKVPGSASRFTSENVLYLFFSAWRQTLPGGSRQLGGTLCCRAAIMGFDPAATNAIALVQVA